MDWQPIKTAPKDGTRFLATNGKLFAACYWYVRIEEEETCLGYDEGLIGKSGYPIIGPRFSERIKNPKAGQIAIQMWMKDNPSAFAEEDEVGVDYDDAFPSWEPTHWAPMIEPPSFEFSGHATVSRSGFSSPPAGSASEQCP